MIGNLKNGMTIYFYRGLGPHVIRGVVKDSSLQDTGSDNAKIIKFVDWKGLINREGKEIRALEGTSNVRLDRAFLTAKEANDAKKAEIEKRKDELRKEITDLESLFKFPFKHCLIGGKNTDWQAVDIYDEYIEKYKKGEIK